MLKSFFNDAKFYFLVRGLLSIAFLLSIKIYTYFLDTTHYGVYSVVFFMITIFSVCTTSWLSASIVRMYPEWTTQKINFTPTVLTLLISTLSLFAPILFTILYVSKYTGFLPIDLDTIIYSLAYFIVLSIFNFLIARFSAMREVKTLTIYSVFQFFFGVALATILLKMTDLGFNSILLGQTISYSLFCIYILYKQNLLPVKWTIDKEIFHEILQYGIPVLFLNIAANLLISSDQLVLKYFNFNEQLGAYAANYTLTDKSITVMTGIFSTAYAPIMFGIFETEDSSKAYGFFYKLISIYFVVAIPLVVFIYYWYDEIFGLLINGNYRMIEIVPFILLGSLFLNVSNIFSDILTLNKKTKLMAFCYVLPLIMSIGLNFYFIPLHGAKAASIVTAISYFSLMISTVSCALYYIQKSRRIEIH